MDVVQGGVENGKNFIKPTLILKKKYEEIN